MNKRTGYLKVIDEGDNKLQLVLTEGIKIPSNCGTIVITDIIGLGIALVTIRIANTNRNRILKLMTLC